MTDSIADDLLRSGYDRWVRLEEEKAGVSEDLKALFAELKSAGFDTKALRASFRRVSKIGDADQQEQEALVDLYVASLTRDPRVRAREIIEQFGTVSTFVPVNSAQSDPSGVAADRATEATPPASVATHHENTPEESGTAREAPGSSAPSDGIADLSEDPEHSSAGGPVAQSAAVAVEQEVVRPAPRTPSVTTTEPAAGATPASGRPNSSPTTGADTGETVSTPVSPVAIRKPFRPHCLDRQACAGMGNHHCSRCERAYLAKLDPVG